MVKLTLQSITKGFGDRYLFKDLNLSLESGTRLAVIGPNGCGKTSLLKIIVGISAPDSGKVIMPKGIRPGYVAQELGQGDLELSAMEYVLLEIPSWTSFWKKWDRAESQTDLNELSQKQVELEHRYGFNPEHRAKTILSGLGFDENQWDMPLGALSGGWQERAKLARSMLAGRDVLLLDEPTNHLDLEAVLWLEEYLKSFEGILIFVAHDKILLDKISTHILSLHGSRPVMRKGNLSAFMVWQSEREELKGKRLASIEQKIDQKQQFVDRFRYKATKAAQAQSRLKQIDRLKQEQEELLPERRRRTLDFSWPTPVRGSKIPVSCVDLTFSYPGIEPMWPPLTFHVIRGQKLGILGANGSGKSTLLKLMAEELTPSSGRISLGSNTVPAYFSQQQQEILNLEATVLGEIRRLSHPHTTEEELRSVLGLFLLFESVWERKVHTLSGGEKNRLVLASLFLKRANLLILDEPTNHLDLESREALAEALRSFEETIVLVAHDRALLREVARDLWKLDAQGLTPVMGDLDSYLGEIVEPPAGGHTADQSRESLRKRDRRGEEKRHQAELRNTFYRTLKPLKEEYQSRERELESILEKQEKLEQQLSDPALYEQPDRLAELSRQLKEVQNSGDEVMEKLARLEKAIQEVESEKDELLGDLR